MYRIGIVGSDNSHAITFSRMINDPNNPFHVEGFKVTHIFGLNNDRNREVAKKGGIENIVSDPLEMMGKVDCVFIEFRDGALHLKYARPFIERGIPLFIDKPLAASVEDAEKIVSLAKKYNTLLTSFSILRFSDEVLEVKKNLENIIYLTITGPGDPDSIYSGLIFYGIHVAEIIDTIIGYRSGKIYALRKGKNISALFDINKPPIINIRISNNIPHKFSIEMLTKNERKSLDIENYNKYYRRGLKKIKEMLDKNIWPIKPENMIYPIKIIDAIKKSYTYNSIEKIF